MIECRMPSGKVETRAPQYLHLTEHTPNPTVKEAAEYFKSDRGYSPKSIKRWIEDHGELTVTNGVIFSANDGQTSK